MHSLRVDCDSFSTEEKSSVVIPVASVVINATGSNATFALTFSTLLLECLVESMGMSALG